MKPFSIDLEIKRSAGSEGGGRSAHWKLSLPIGTCNWIQVDSDDSLFGQLLQGKVAYPHVASFSTPKGECTPSDFASAWATLPLCSLPQGMENQRLEQVAHWLIRLFRRESVSEQIFQKLGKLQWEKYRAETWRQSPTRLAVSVISLICGHEKSLWVVQGPLPSEPPFSDTRALLGSMERLCREEQKALLVVSPFPVRAMGWKKITWLRRNSTELLTQGEDLHVA